MAITDLSDLTWEELRALDKARAVVILPVGATEAHGPHLPLGTDVIIAQAMARRGAEKLERRGATVLLAPPLAYTVANYAAGFAGTVSIRPETEHALLEDIAHSLSAHGIRYLALANAHLEPAHIGALHAAAEHITAAGLLTVVFPDVTRKPWALRLTDEFKSGACHAGQFEGSIVMAERPELVREEIRRELPANPASLSRAIRDGKSTFEAAGGPRAYFGYPAQASAAEGQDTIEVLGALLDEAVAARMLGLD